MKKILAFALLATMTIGLISGCGGGSGGATTAGATTKGGETTAAADSSKETTASGESTTLKVAAFQGGYGADYWEKVAALFEKSHPGVKVELTINPQIGDVIRPQILSGNPPDFIYLPSTNNSGVAQALIKDKGLADLSDVFTTELKGKVLDGFLDSKLLQPYGDGKIYLAPLYYSPTGLWYNQNFFEKSSLKPPVTWEDFFGLKDKITDRSVFTYQGSHPSYLECLIIPSIASAAGSQVMDDCLNYVEGAWKNPKVIETLDNIAKIGTDGLLLPGTQAMQFSEAQAQFVLGKAALIPNGTWFEGEMADSPKEEGFVWGFTAPPVDKTAKDKYLFTSCEEMYIPAAAANIDLAKEFLAFQYSDEAVALNAELSKGVPPIKGAVDKLKPYVSDATYEAMKIFEDGYKPYIGNFAPVEGTEIIPRDDFFAQVGEVLSGNMTGTQWAEHMEEVSAQVRDHIVK